jgi:PAS domain S-box-containing protein
VVVLIAEDDTVTRRSLVRLLEGWGHQVIACEDGEKAWQAFQAKVPPILLVDWVMPGMDGLDLCRAVRLHRVGADVQIVMLTARADLSDVEAALRAGADDYLVKPVDLSQLKIRLQVATHRLQLQALLRESEERQQHIMAYLPAVVWAVDREGVISYCGGAGLKAMGLDASDLLGRHIAEAFAGCRQITAGNATALTGRQVNVDDTFQGRALMARITPMWGHLDEVVGAVGVAQDISVQRQLEAQAGHSMKMELLGQLVAGIAHDFNNLLAGMMGNLELAQLDADGETRSCLDNVMEAAQHGAKLTQQLLAYSRKRDPGMQSVDPGDLCGQVVRLLRRTLKGGIDIELDVQGNVPALWGDPEQLHQVVMNLCVNARDAIVEARRTDPAGAERRGVIRVRVGSCPAGGEAVAGVSPPYIYIEVADSGCGMDAETRARAFDPFFTTKGEGHGTGLGLATMQRLVDQHKGGVTVDSIQGRGTTFTVCLPIVGDRPAGPDEPAKRPARGQHPSTGAARAAH